MILFHAILFCLSLVCSFAQAEDAPHATVVRKERPPSPEENVAAAKWERGKWLEHGCLDATVSVKGMFLYGSPVVADQEILFCVGGETECQSQNAQWAEGTPQLRSDGRKSAYLPLTLPPGDKTIVTLRSNDRGGKPCYRTVAVGRVDDTAYIFPVQDKEATLTPPLPVSERLVSKMQEINEFRRGKNLFPIAYDEQTIAAYRANAEPGIQAINRERAANNLGPLEFDFVLSVIARTNNDLPTQRGWLGYAHEYTGGTAQVWARGQATASGAVHIWVNDDLAWKNAHKHIVLGGYTKVGFAATPVGTAIDYSADFGN